MIFTLKTHHIYTCGGAFLERTELTVSDANITPYEHTSFYPPYVCLYSLALAVRASSQLKRQFVL